MFGSLYRKLREKLFYWLVHEPKSDEIMPYDFNRLKYELRPGDVLLIEGRSRISRIIRYISQSPWTHAALYVGRLIDFEDEELLNAIKKHSNGFKDKTHLILEDLLDKGTVITSLNVYRDQHIRICRPIGITPADLYLVIRFAINSLGQPYNVRHLLDLTRFVLPWTILPRRWGSTLFRKSTGEPDPGICSSLIAAAFASVQFPILPFVITNENETAGIEVFPRNPHLYTPKDFDYSPYFEIIKYPLFNPDEPLPYYRRLPWTKTGFLHQDNGILTAPHHPKERRGLRLFKRRDKTIQKPDDNNSNKNK